MYVFRHFVSDGTHVYPEKCLPSAHINCHDEEEEEEEGEGGREPRVEILHVANASYVKEELGRRLRGRVEDWAGIGVELTQVYGIRQGCSKWACCLGTASSFSTRFRFFNIRFTISFPISGFRFRSPFPVSGLRFRSPVSVSGFRFRFPVSVFRLRLVLGFVFLFRRYRRGSTLALHVDRLDTHVLSAIINVNQKVCLTH